MKYAILVVVGILAASPVWSAAAPAAAPAAAHIAAPTAAPTASAVLAELKAGNQRHAKAQYMHPHESAARRQELARGQEPRARVAGNIAPDAEVASIEYAFEHLHTPLVVVMGHQSCGAVGAAIEGGQAPGHLPALVEAIRPAVEQARKLSGDLSDNSIRLNVEMVVDQLRASEPVLAEAVAAGKLRIVGAVYSLATGSVTWLPEKAP